MKPKEKNYLFSFSLGVFNRKTMKTDELAPAAPSSVPILSALSTFIQLLNKHPSALSVFTEHLLLPALTRHWFSPKTMSPTMQLSPTKAAGPQNIQILEWRGWERIANQHPLPPHCLIRPLLQLHEKPLCLLWSHHLETLSCTPPRCDCSPHSWALTSFTEDSGLWLTGLLSSLPQFPALLASQKSHPTSSAHICRLTQLS